ncbi:unnamed protein product [Protopolystoma xenopodis]|uniref:Uncharacterized protein n=1 Tax=Protopolystoma xenopodis TaxID=117903 RepID=A0A448XRK0_9PLAT|nr:unnamed protein product [Protopolystoma xenopodis]
MVLTSLTLVQHVRANSSTKPDVPNYAAPLMRFLESSDDVHHMMDESSAHFHPIRGRKSCGLRQHDYRLKSNEIHPSSSACALWLHGNSAIKYDSNDSGGVGVGVVEVVGGWDDGSDSDVSGDDGDGGRVGDSR